MENAQINLTFIPDAPTTNLLNKQAKLFLPVLLWKEKIPIKFFFFAEIILFSAKRKFLSLEKLSSS